MKILITGFEPFLGEKINPSQLALEALSQEGLHKLILPVSYSRAWPLLQHQLVQLKPEVVLMLGQAGGRKNICLEKYALNWCESPSADEDGEHRRSEKISLQGPDHYQSSFPVEDWALRLQNEGIACQSSLSAGGFVCNFVSYQVAHECAKKFPSTKWMFVHMPYLPEQQKTPSLPLQEDLKALSLILQLVQGRG